ncbi:MAG: Ppx/GppA family phosphatase [Bacteroidetes bacterium]|nr:Ppx/GppA family phosphatase [Bacteroidota bacterium]
MRTGVIDIGTNTILLLVTDAAEGKLGAVLHDEQVIARLGKGVDAERMIGPETFLRAEGFLRTYRATCDALNVERICAVGTSALRDARNRDEFCRHIRGSTGIDIEILSGADEAYWTYRGGISEFIGRSDRYSVVDIGGGSTEVIIGSGTGIESSTSIDIGAVRLTERILRSSPPETSALIEAHDYIRSLMVPVTAELNTTFAVGVAGTVTTLAALHQKLPRYQPEKVSGYALSYEDIGAMFGMLKDRSTAQIAAFPQISAGRADIILAGIMILLGYMEAGSLKRITVSDRGLRYGIALREAERTV